MKILFLTNKVPYPPKDGGAIATFNMSKAFHKLGCKLRMLSINTPKHNIPTEDTPKAFVDMAGFESVFVDTEIRLGAALKNLFTSESYNVERFYSKAYEKRLIEILKEEKFDLIQLEGLHICRYLDTIRKHSQARIAFRAHNIEFMIWQRFAAAEKNPLKRQYVGLLAKRMKRFELEVMNKVDALIPITQQDADTFRSLGCTRPIYVAPTGVDAENYKVNYSRMAWPSLFHLGAMDWLPNQQGVQWFAKEVWPQLHQDYPKLTAWMAGRHTPDWLKNLESPDFHMVGEVPDAIEFMNAKGIMVVPLHSGSGMRIKIIEGMALGKPIVATSIGAEGINCTDGKDILLADTAEDFIHAIGRLTEDRKYAEEVGRNSRKLVETEYDNLTLVKGLLGFYSGVVKG